MRSVPVPARAKATLDRWTKAAGITEGKLFRRVNKADAVTGDSLNPASDLCHCGALQPAALDMLCAADHALTTSWPCGTKGRRSLAQRPIYVGLRKKSVVASMVRQELPLYIIAGATIGATIEQPVKILTVDNSAVVGRLIGDVLTPLAQQIGFVAKFGKVRTGDEGGLWGGSGSRR